MLRKFFNWWRDRFSTFVIADATDNSITFSKRLFKRLDVMSQSQAKVYMFHVPQHDCYGFVLNPPIEQETHLAEIQYNTKHRCVGFEALVPTVNRIFYDYGIPADTKCCLTVEEKKVGDMKYYLIRRPYGKHFA